LTRPTIRDTWEPAETLAVDVPAVVRQFLRGYRGEAREIDELLCSLD